MDLTDGLADNPNDVLVIILKLESLIALMCSPVQLHQAIHNFIIYLWSGTGLT